MQNIFSKEGLINFLYVIPILLFSLAVHEFAHAYTAYKLGDRSQKQRGRLTLDPFKSVDWIGFLSIALVGFGWGKPVIVDDNNFKNRSKGNMLVSIAGPLSNLVIALILTLVLKILIMTGILNLALTNTVGNIFIEMLRLGIVYNVIFAIFNMLPIPPFDGSKVLFYFLPGKCKKIMYILEQYSFLIILILLITNLYSFIINPIVNGILNLINMFLLL